MLAVMVILTVGCSGNGSDKKTEDAGITEHHQLPPKDTLGIELKVLEIHDYLPERALRILDSALVVGSLEEKRAEMLRAKVYSQTLMGTQMDALLGGVANIRYDSARVIGERLLADGAVRQNLALHQNVLEVLIVCGRQQLDTARWLGYSQELVKVCRKQGAETEALRTQAEIGSVLCLKGDTEGGMRKIDFAIEHLGNGRKFNELDAQIIALKRKINALNSAGRYAEILPLAYQIIERLDDYELHPSEYHDSTYREPADSADRADYIEFYRSQARGFIAAAYSVLGKKQSLEQVYELIDSTVRAATAREHITRYQALEQKAEKERRLAEVRHHSQLMSLVALANSVGFVLMLLLAFVIYYKNRNIRQRNHALVRQINETMDFKEKYQTLKAETMKERQPLLVCPEDGVGQLSDNDLFLYLSDVILREMLYLDPLFNREKLCQRFGLSEHRVGAAFSKGSRFGSLPAFVRDLRLNYACQLLRQHGDMPVSEVARRSGFSNHRSFSTDFRRHFGLSPTEYRQQES